jgi:outer membrane protein assembly factor BamD
MSTLRIVLFAAVLMMLAQSMAQATLVWRPGEGWSDESGGDISASSSREQLEKAHKLEAEGQRDDALKAYKALLRRWPLSFFAPEAQFRMGKIMEDEADYYNSFKSFQAMVKKYPSSTYFEQALGEQYRIANLYLAGEPQRIWKIPVGPSMDKTVEMYNQIIKNAPYGTYAAESQFKIGLAREQQRKYTDAVDAYQKVLDNYPTSATASNAQYQIGYAWMRATDNANDEGAARKAIDAFQDYLVRYPNSDKAPQAQENIQHLGQKQTQGAYDIAQFYERSHPDNATEKAASMRAAYIYYNEVVREDPNSPEAQKAKKRIQELRPLVEVMPGGAGPDGTPAPALAANPSVPSAPTDPLPSTAPASTPEPPMTGPGDVTTPGPTTEPSAGPPDPGTAAAGTPAPGASTPGDAPTTNAAPASAPADGTPLPQ